MGTTKSRVCLQIAKINLRHNFILHFALAVITILLTPILFGINNLDATASATPLEVFVSLTGVILLVPIFQPEESTEINDVTTSKYMSSMHVYIIRIVYSIISIILLISIFLIFMRTRACSVIPALWFGTIADAMFLGSLGLLTAAITNNTPISYMIPLAYYALNYTAGRKLGYFYLFSMMSGEYKPNVFLFGASVVLIAFALLIKHIIKRCR